MKKQTICTYFYPQMRYQWQSELYWFDWRNWSSRGGFVGFVPSFTKSRIRTNGRQCETWRKHSERDEGMFECWRSQRARRFIRGYVCKIFCEKRVWFRDCLILRHPEFWFVFSLQCSHLGGALWNFSWLHVFACCNILGWAKMIFSVLNQTVRILLDTSFLVSHVHVYSKNMTKLRNIMY